VKVTLESIWGDQETLQILDPLCPELTDELGRPVVDLSPFGRVLPSAQPQNTPGFKFVLDAFVVRPSPGLSTAWLTFPPDNVAYQNVFEDWVIAIGLLTGKRLVSVSK
jgi:hypothetical protein